MRKIIAVLSMACLLLISGCVQPKKTELVISAAASLQESLKEIQAIYEKSHPDITLTFNFGSSGTLQQQIEHGAPVDLFFSAGKKQMETLVANHLVDLAQQRTLLSNSLVVIIPNDAKSNLQTIGDLTKSDLHKLTIGEPETVPAGSYARQALVNAKVWDVLLSRIVFAKDVRQALIYVETGNADAGLVYQTDARASTKVKVALTVDPNSYSPIEYPLGVIETSKHKKEALLFYNYLLGKEAEEIFTKNGFAQVKQ